jgi:3-methyladenine DNA glycosylase AlkD
MSNLSNLKKEMKSLADPRQAENLSRFFKTGPGQYGEGDIFYGIRVPETRKIAKKFCNLPLSDIGKLIRSEVHEERLCALLILVAKFSGGKAEERGRVFNFYLKNTLSANNWDLVDLSADKIVGEYLADKPRDMLHKLARSKNLWEKRIAIIATFAFIKRGDAADTYELAEILMHDKHDLIQKAVGWMLREAGKRVSEPELEKFLVKNSGKMPRTMLRYAIERLPEGKRKKYLQVGGIKKSGLIDEKNLTHIK